MNSLPEALRVAQALEQQFPLGTSQHFLDGEAAHLLREQHAEIKRLRKAVLEEREACAHIAENGLLGLTIAKAIRARGEKP